MRSATLQAIRGGGRGDAQALAFLQERATNDPEPKTRTAALWAIGYGWRGDAQVLAFLQERATNDPEPKTRAAARLASANARRMGY